MAYNPASARTKEASPGTDDFGGVQNMVFPAGSLVGLGHGTVQVVLSTALGNMVVGEVPDGLVDGANAVFTLAHAPDSGSLMLWRSYTLMYPGVHYNLVGDTITYVSGEEPAAGPPADTHVVIYRYL